MIGKQFKRKKILIWIFNFDETKKKKTKKYGKSSMGKQRKEIIDNDHDHNKDWGSFFLGINKFNIQIETKWLIEILIFVLLCFLWENKTKN